MSRTTLQNILIHIGMYSIILKMLFDSVLIVALIVFCGLGLLTSAMKFDGFLKIRYVTLFIILIFSAALFNATFVIFDLIHSISYLIITASVSIIAYFLANLPTREKAAFFNYLLMFYLVLVFSSYFIDPSGFRYGNFFDFGSVNLVTAILFFISSISFFVSRNIYLLVVSILSMTFFGIIGDSRSALILVLMLIILGVVFIIINFKKRSTRYLAFLGISLLFSTFTLSIFSQLFEILADTRLYSFGLQSVRFVMWGEWYESLDFESVFLGIDLMQLPMIAMYNGNPHNSLIYAHSRYGFSAVILFLFFIYYMIKYIRFDIVGFLIFFFILIRSLSDILIIFLPLDVFLFFLIFSLSSDVSEPSGRAEALD